MSDAAAARARLRLVVDVARGVSRARADAAAIAAAVAQALTRELADGALVVLESPTGLVRSAHRRADAAEALQALVSELDPTAFPTAGPLAGGARLVPAAGVASAAWQEHARRFPHHDLLVAPIRTEEACLGRVVLLRDRPLAGAPGVPFADDDVAAVSECLEHVTLALEHAIATQALERRERQLTIATNAMSALVYEWDVASGAVDRTTALHALVGFHPEEVPATSDWWTDRVHPEDRERIARDAVGIVARRQTHVAHEYRVRHRDGHYLWVWDHIHIEYDERGAPVRMVGCTIDIEERKRAEEARRRSEELAHEAAARAEAERAVLDAILEAAPAGIILADAQGRLVRFNRANERLWGPAPLSESVDEYRAWKGWWADQSERHGRPVEPHEWAMARALRGEPARDDIIEIEPFDRPGTRRTMVNSGAAVRDAEGRIIGAVVAQMDISALVEAQEALREADRRKDEFIAILAHELRNPLAPVCHAIQIMRRLGTTDPWIERTRDVIDRQVTHMARLIDDLLDVSRIARGKLLLQTQTCDLAAIARQTAEDHRPTLEAGGLTLRVAGSSDAVWVEGDPVRLAQMIGNLLHNARRFTSEGGVVEVRTEVEAASRLAVVSVTDTGVGMDPALLSRLFDPFSQAGQDLARSKGGLGMGLALTKGLAELHGGGVAAHSEGPGCGSTFAVRIPLSKVRREPVSTPEPGVRSREGDKLRILVVEDNEDAAETLGELLALEGHEVELAFDGASAVAAARERQPDVVISDIGLPGELDGYGVARTLRAAPELAGVYLIALSGYANEDARRRSREAGFDAHFAKPPDIARLEQALADVGGRPAVTAPS